MPGGSALNQVCRRPCPVDASSRGQNVYDEPGAHFQLYIIAQGTHFRGIYCDGKKAWRTSAIFSGVGCHLENPASFCRKKTMDECTGVKERVASPVCWKPEQYLCSLASTINDSRRNFDVFKYSIGTLGGVIQCGKKMINDSGLSEFARRVSRCAFIFSMSSSQKGGFTSKDPSTG
jgi:hypothetical protein